MNEPIVINAFVTCYREDGSGWEMTLMGTNAPLPDAVLKEIAGGKVHVTLRRRKSGVIPHHRPKPLVVRVVR